MKPWIKFIFPFVYSLIFIIGVHYIFNVTYFVSNFVLFYVPCLVFLTLSFQELKENWKQFLLVFLIFIPLTTAYEYLSLWLDIWNFNQSFHKLIGINILGAPLEEFLFWYGAGPFILSLYFYFNNLTKVKS